MATVVVGLLAVSSWSRPLQLLSAHQPPGTTGAPAQLESFVRTVAEHVPPHSRVVFFVPEEWTEEGYFGYRAGYLLPRRWAYLGVRVPAMGAPRFLEKGDYAAFWPTATPVNGTKVWEGEGGILLRTSR